MATVVVTGATGFIGGHLLSVLAGRGHETVSVGRRPAAKASRSFEIGEIGAATDWSVALKGADAIVHLAGLAHGKARSDEEFATVNGEGTRRLCEAAAVVGARTLVNVSTIAARDVDIGPARLAAYGRSKLDAEAHVAAFAERTAAAGISLRPPLVYAWDAPANWRQLQRLAASGMPLPFGSVHNRRSFCAVENLCDAIAVAVERGLSGHASGIYEIADAEIMSLPEVIACLRRGMGMPARLVPVPPVLMRLGARLTGRDEMVETLLRDTVATPHRFMRSFGWSPVISGADAMAASGRRFLTGR